MFLLLELHIPLAVQLTEPDHPDSVHEMFVTPLRSYPLLQLNVANSPKVVPPSVSALPFVGTGLPQSSR